MSDQDPELKTEDESIPLPPSFSFRVVSLRHAPIELWGRESRGPEP
jgi:hypothetical protein